LAAKAEEGKTKVKNKRKKVVSKKEIIFFIWTGFYSGSY
jgi:hypothetical protein